MKAEEAWQELRMARAVVRGWQITLLKACDWTPVGEQGIGGWLTGQDLIDAGEPCRWSRGVVGEEPWDEEEAVDFAERALIDELNAASAARSRIAVVEPESEATT